MLLAKIKGNKVYFGKLVTFFGKRGGQFTPYRPPRPLRRCLQGVTCSKIFQGGVSPNFKSQGGGSDPLGPPHGHLCVYQILNIFQGSVTQGLLKFLRVPQGYLKKSSYSCAILKFLLLSSFISRAQQKQISLDMVLNFYFVPKRGISTENHFPQYIVKKTLEYICFYYRDLLNYI